jgi:hypothetical protein
VSDYYHYYQETVEAPLLLDTRKTTTVKLTRPSMLLPLLIVASIIGVVATVAIRRHVLYGDALCTTCDVVVDYWHPKVDEKPVIAP